MADAWVRATRLVGALTVPALCGLVVVAPDFVTVILGDRWSEAIPVIQVLRWVGLLQSLQSLNGDMLQALDRTTLLFRYSLFFFAMHMTAFACGIPFGVLGVAVAYAISSTVVEPVYACLTARALGISVWRFVGGLLGVAQAAVLMALAVLGVRLGLESLGVGAPLRLVACILAGLAVYPLAVRWRAPEVLAEVRAVRARRRARRGPARRGVATPRRAPARRRGPRPRARSRAMATTGRRALAATRAGAPSTPRAGGAHERPKQEPRRHFRVRRVPWPRPGQDACRVAIPHGHAVAGCAD